MKDKSTSLTVHGILNIVSPVIAVFLTFIVSALFVAVRIYSGVMQMPLWMLFASESPLLICPVSCIWGIIRGIVNQKSRGATLCILLSIAGIVLFILMFVALFLFTSPV